MSARPPRKQNPEPSVIGDTYISHANLNDPTFDASAPISPPPYPPLPPPDPRDLGLHREQPPRDVPYLPTDQHVVNKMLEMAKVGKNDILYDLGCGDGRICITAAKLGAKAIGVEIDLIRLRECHDNLRNTQLKDRVEFRRQSFFDVDLRPATVVALYLLPAINKLLRPKLLFELRPGSRIIANYFEIANWIPDEQVIFKHRPVMLWIVPAWVQGNYKVFLRTTGGRVTHAHLTLTRNIQFVSGTLRFGRKTLPITGRLRGTQLDLTVPELPTLSGPVNIKAVYDDGANRKSNASLAGTFKSATTNGHLAAIRIEQGS